MSKPMSQPRDLGLKKQVLIRQQFIDAMLVEHGFITRKILIDALGIEAVTASRDLATYAALNNTVYLNRKLKRWERLEHFKPVEGLSHLPASTFLPAFGKVFNVRFGDVVVKAEFGVISGANAIVEAQ